jgi:hypothetical protein
MALSALGGSRTRRCNLGGRPIRSTFAIALSGAGAKASPEVIDFKGAKKRSFWGLTVNFSLLILITKTEVAAVNVGQRDYADVPRDSVHRWPKLRRIDSRVDPRINFSFEGKFDSWEVKGSKTATDPLGLFSQCLRGRNLIRGDYVFTPTDDFPIRFVVAYTPIE